MASSVPVLSPPLHHQPILADASLAAPEPSEQPVTVIRPLSGWQLVNFRELWQFRELIFFLTWRDVKVRYKQTFLGAAWALLQPGLMMVVFTIFFSRMAGLPSGSLPYPVFVFAGLLPWTFFSNAVSTAGQSVVGNQNLITKVYFPRLIIPMGAVGAGLVDFAIAFGMLLALMLCFGVVPGWGFLLVPLLTLIVVTAALGLGTLLCALTVAYRDFRYVVPFMMQLWMFATPSIYMDPEALASSAWKPLLPLNPMYGLIVNFRAAVLGGALDLYALAVSAGMSVLLLLAGCFYFRRVERNFADII
jgi:lipopolysaccharide transport system permease protein